ncbi:MAG: glycosyl transferase family 2, partial [Candidatus Omnitrophica bacterium CG12_big_fil_rev_8_21_14_0_65_50_5]
FSHKVLRWLAPFFLAVAFAANIFLLTSGRPYIFIFILQCAFYSAALAGRGMVRRKKQFKLLSLAYYFASMNLALFLGFLKFLQGTQSVKWNRTER